MEIAWRKLTASKSVHEFHFDEECIFYNSLVGPNLYNMSIVYGTCLYYMYDTLKALWG